MIDRQEEYRKWLDALRSGEYKQCQDKLTDGEGFCCLGVYCEVNGIEIPVRNAEPDDDTPGANGDAYNELRKRLPDLGLVGLSKCSSMNDNGTSFAEIADFVEPIIMFPWGGVR